VSGTRAPIAILGGGPAGLAAAHYAREASLPFELFEASHEVGGNCRTIRFGEFLVDTGAHRLHDRDAETTRIARDLLGDRLLSVDAPSQLHYGGRLIDFPLAPLDLSRKLPLRTLARIARENIALRVGGGARGESFGELARSTYGETLASIALLEYSRKLWGRDPDTLVPEVAGTRLARLDLRTFLVESFGDRRRARRHLDGSFLYPANGIGELFSRMGSSGGARVHTGAAVRALHHDGARIVGVEVDGSAAIEPSHVIDTLPLGIAASLLRPAPPEDVLAAARAIGFRHLRLCVVMLSRERFSPNASIYFPDAAIPFTRLYEPKNRSAAMAPKGATSLVLEVPCERSDRLWQLDAEAFCASIVDALVGALGVDRREIIETHDLLVPNAYPVLEIAAVAHVARLHEYFARFENHTLVGRNARFRYSSIHDMFIGARAAIAPLAH
jgi:protoporphyrinogen oxidase